MKHEIKIWPEYLKLLVSGDKVCEVRRDDRNYCVGDILVLREWSPLARAYTGRYAEALVTHVLRGWGLKDGWVAMSIRLLWFDRDANPIAGEESESESKNR